MQLAWLALIAGQTLAPAETWVCHEEAYALQMAGPELAASTFGGVLKYRNGRWESVDSPVGQPVRGHLSEPVRSARAEFDEAKNLVLNSQSGESIGRPGTGKIYALHDHKEDTFAATSDGIWRYTQGAWAREKLPSQSPMPRLQGLAPAGRRGWIAGGLGGLFIGRPGEWEKLNDKSVRRIVPGRNDELWIIYGDGTLDKMETEQDRWAHDVLYGMVKRPWASCLSVIGETTLIGGQGGWVEKTAKGQSEEHPEWLAGDVVTALTLWKGRLIVGGQKTGLHIRDGKTWRHLNAAHGLEDLWITDLCEWNGRLMIATSGGGLHEWDGRKLTKKDGPDNRLTALTHWKGSLMAGSMAGAFVSDGRDWKLMGSDAEVTALVPDAKSLHVVLANRVQVYR